MRELFGFEYMKDGARKSLRKSPVSKLSFLKLNFETGSLSKSGPLHFELEKCFPSNFSR